MNQLKRIYNFNFVADFVMAEAISRFCSTYAVSSSTSRSPGPETMDCYNCDRPDEAARAGEAREGTGSREPSVCFRCDRSGHLAMECPVTADRGTRSGGSVCCRLVQS